MQVYLVGGAVRDELLGRKVGERDWVVVGATPEQMKQQGYQQVGKDFPVFLHPKTREEYALARTERKSSAGYTGFDCQFDETVTLEEDLIRRDLTVNAMARDEQGNLIDPYGGQSDLADKKLRHVSDAFVEDPLRVLRVARFAARYQHQGFTVDQSTMELMAQIAKSGELETISSERIWKETATALVEENPEVYFSVLRECGALAVLFPEIDALWGVPNPEQWHPEIDTGIHVLMVLQQARKFTDKLEVIFAALTHDLGKGKTDPKIWPSHTGHEKSGLAVIEQLCERLKVPNSCRDLALLVCEFHTHCHRAFQLKAETIIKLFDSLDVWRKPQRLDDFLLACIADSKGRKGLENRPYPQAEYLKNAYQIAVAVNVQEVIAEGYQGAEIRQRLKAKQVAAIKPLVIANRSE